MPPSDSERDEKTDLEKATAKLGASDVRHHEDGTVTVDGEEVDNPDDYKGDPIPGGPTDSDSTPQPGDKSMGKGVADGVGDDDKRDDQPPIDAG